MRNIECHRHMENYFLHLTHWHCKILKTQISINGQWAVHLHDNHHE